MNEEKVNVPIYEILLIMGIVLIIIGLVAQMQMIKILGIKIWFDANLSKICILIGVYFVCGYITRKLLLDKKGTFIIGLTLGILGVILAIITRLISNKKNNNSSNKYEDLQKLMELKQKGILTDVEYEIEKAKILR